MNGRIHPQTVFSWNIHFILGPLTIMATTARAIPAEPSGKKEGKKSHGTKEEKTISRNCLYLEYIHHFGAFPELLLLQWQPQQDENS